jgi:hypothetical protein
LIASDFDDPKKFFPDRRAAGRCDILDEIRALDGTIRAGVIQEFSEPSDWTGAPVPIQSERIRR